MTQTTDPPARARHLHRLLVAGAALLLPAAVVGAAAPATAATTAAAETSWVRAVHLVPELGAMTISLVPFSGSGTGEVPDGEVPEAPVVAGERVLATAATYGAAGEYRQVPVGTYTVAVRPADADPSSDPILTGTLDAEADRAYTLAGIGSKDSPRIETLGDDLEPPEQGSAKVRLLPAASNAPSVDVVAQDGPTVADAAEFATPTGYATVPDGPWTLQVSASDEAAQELTTTEVDLAGGAVYTLLLLDEGSAGVRLEPLVDAVGMDVAPREGVQTGGGGTAPGRLPPGLTLGLGSALLGALALALGRGSRPERVR